MIKLYDFKSSPNCQRVKIVLAEKNLPYEIVPIDLRKQEQKTPEYLKLNLDQVDVFGSSIDRIYVWRRSQNVDRKIRRRGGIGLKPLHAPAVLDFFETVRAHLEDDWAAPEDWDSSGILK